MGIILSIFRRQRQEGRSEPWEEVRGTRCIFVGDTSGKTQLFRRVLGRPFQTTNLDACGDFEYRTVPYENGEEDLLLLLFDAGAAYDQTPLDRTAYLFMLTRGVQVIWLVFDLTKKETFTILDEYMGALKSNVGQDAVIALVGNKADLAAKRTVSPTEAAEFVARHHLCKYFETSARNGSGVPEMFYDVLELHTQQKLRRRGFQIPTRLTHEQETRAPVSRKLAVFPESIPETSDDLAPLLASTKDPFDDPPFYVGTLESRSVNSLARGNYYRDGVRKVGNDVSSSPSRRVDSSSMNNLPCYKMSARPRGMCIIINNENFSGAAVSHTAAAAAVTAAAAAASPSEPADAQLEKLTDRVGSKLDANMLLKTFRSLHFDVQVHTDLTDGDMDRLFRQLSLKDHSKYDCFACCILSHGSLGRIYGVNGGVFEISDMTGYFRARSCPSLAGKPKLFFLQSCQGREHLRGLQVKSETMLDAPDDAGFLNIIPDEADFLLGYATVPGYAAIRNTAKGSWYIIALCEVLEKYGSDLDILNILVKVNKQVSEKLTMIEGEYCTQVPAPLFTLTKRLLLSK